MIDVPVGSSTEHGSSDDVVVRLEVDDGVAVITIVRPHVRNAVDHAVAIGIEAHLDHIEADETIRAAVITGAGSYFCSGADLRMIADHEPAAMTERGGFAGFAERKRQTPVIAAVEGGALAGGFEVVLACDLVVASSSATFGIPEVTRGLIAGGGGLVRLAHRIPRNVAMELAVLGGTIDAPAAHRLGLVNRLVDDGEALVVARSLARAIAANPSVAVRESRNVLTCSADEGEESGWERNRAAMATIQATEDYIEGPRAFLEKRPARWS